MTSKKIQRIISTKGNDVQIVFNELVEWLNGLTSKIDNTLAKTVITDDVIAIISYNITIRLMKKMLDNQDYFVGNGIIKERNITKIQKDLKEMSFIEYSPPASLYNLEDFEKEIVDTMSVQ